MWLAGDVSSQSMFVLLCAFSFLTLGSVFRVVVVRFDFFSCVVWVVLLLFFFFVCSLAIAFFCVVFFFFYASAADSYIHSFPDGLPS